MIKDQLTEFYTDLTAHDYECLVFESVDETNILVRTSDPYLCAQYRFVPVSGDNAAPDVYRFYSYHISRCALIADVDNNIPFEEIIESYIYNLGRAYNLIRYYHFNGTKAVHISKDLSEHFGTAQHSKEESQPVTFDL